MNQDDRMALEQAICAVFDMPLTTRWYVVAETINEDGEPYLMGLGSPGIAPWAAQGMLRYEADSLSAQPQWGIDP